MGADKILFYFSPNPGEAIQPLSSIASGGEMSRFLLALKACFTVAEQSSNTLIFDEIDTGVGGAVAEAIGERLARLSSNVQVLSVTHAPQVAARANNHFLISKSAVSGEDRVETDLIALDDAARREEVARMLAGQEITDEARAAADRLMGGA